MSGDTQSMRTDEVRRRYLGAEDRLREIYQAASALTESSTQLADAQSAVEQAGRELAAAAGAYRSLLAETQEVVAQVRAIDPASIDSSLSEIRASLERAQRELDGLRGSGSALASEESERHSMLIARADAAAKTAAASSKLAVVSLIASLASLGGIAWLIFQAAGGNW